MGSEALGLVGAVRAPRRLPMKGLCHGTRYFFLIHAIDCELMIICLTLFNSVLALVLAVSILQLTILVEQGFV